MLHVLHPADPHPLVIVARWLSVWRRGWCPRPCEAVRGRRSRRGTPHYQDRIDPVTPSVDPAYANAKNEIWLDFLTNAEGNASVESSVDWKARGGEAQSIIIHENHTMTEAGKGGTAGTRLACIDVDFAPTQ